MIGMKTKTVTIDAKILEQLRKLRKELDEIIETIEVLNNPELVESIRRAEENPEGEEVMSIEEFLEETKKETRESEKKSS